MARRKQNNAVKQLIVVGLVLIAVQIGYVFFWPRPQPVSIQEAIEKAVKAQPVDEKRREQLRVQLSINDYRLKNKNQLPKTLDELVPVYFSRVPIDPSTSQPFTYVVKDNKYYLGDATTAGAGGATNKAASIIPASLDDIKTMSPQLQKALLETLSPESAAAQAPPFVYDATGKRDPFRPFDFAPKTEEDPNKTPLERWDVAQLKLTAVVNDLNGDPTALVENAAGKGFSAKKGAKIGLNGGVIAEIKSDRIIVVETTTDFTGKQKQKTTELRLRTKDQDDKRK